ncbi:hypothetical protein [Paraburkholderia youngii]|uniref:hypothetical protein n=1 Tax=Paraburkholderia youngii TaxID=2782701 RepID=UPI00159291EB|nr:hypothetical protein [Paraburkholderia youngii]NUX58719.1 hypothetical protein [Paraburkholderia youngii]
MSRAIVRADFEAIYKLYANKAVKRFNLTRNHPPQLYGVKLGAEPGKIEKSFSLNKVAAMFFDGTIRKENYRDLLQELTIPGSHIRKTAVAFGVTPPDIVIQINEVWMASERKPAGTTLEGALAESEREEYIPPSRRPDREEKIMVALHAYRYTTMGFCKILDKPKRHAELGPLAPEEITFGGQFSMTLDDE